MAASGLSRVAGLAMLAALVFQGPSAFAAEAVGRAVDISTQVSGQGGALARGDDIHRDERIRSNASGVGAFMFADGTKLAVGPNSTVVIDQYVYAGGSTVKRLAIGATKGTLRWISGKSDHAAYRIQTPSGTLGVRGTAFDIYIARDGTTAVTLLNGAADFCNERGCRTLNRRCEFIIARPGRQTSEPRGITRNIGLGVSGTQAFPFLTGQKRLPRGFQAGSRCAGLQVALPGTMGDNFGLAPAPAPASDTPSGSNTGGDGGGDGGGGGGGDGGGGGGGDTGGGRPRGSAGDGSGSGFGGNPPSDGKNPDNPDL